jgi:hypothetical protein
MNDACFIVRDKNGQALGYSYFEDDRGRRVFRISWVVSLTGPERRLSC